MMREAMDVWVKPGSSGELAMVGLMQFHEGEDRRAKETFCQARGISRESGMPSRSQVSVAGGETGEADVGWR